MKKKVKIENAKDLTIDTFPNNPLKDWKPQFRLDPKCIDAPAIIRGIPKYIPQEDTFLNYLEFRLNQKPTLFERIIGRRLL